MADLEGLVAALVRCDRSTVDVVRRKTQEALDDGVPARKILEGCLLVGMDGLIQQWKTADVRVMEILNAAVAMKGAWALLKPALDKDGVGPVGKVVLGTVQGDLHDVGKNLVVVTLTLAGMEVVDLGVDCSPGKFVEACRQSGAQVCGMSALLTTTMPQMLLVVEALKAAGVAAKTIVGGAPVTQDYADTIGADGYAADAAGAVDVVRELMGAA
jgi:5-methyltetrahydrofolate--homocysteine methyltransferase